MKVPKSTHKLILGFVIKINSRFERVAILESRMNCNLSRYYLSDLEWEEHQGRSFRDINHSERASD